MEKITLSHGSGGKLTHKLIEDLFQRYFDFEELKKNDDGGIFSAQKGQYVVSTDSYVVDPVFFPGGNIGTLSISGTINDLASMGAEPICISVGFILEEGLTFDTLEEIVSSMSSLLNSLNVPIISADTKVVERKGDRESGLFINTTGVGRIFKKCLDKRSIKPGDVIIINGPIAEHGFSVLSVRLGLDRQTPILSDAKPLWDLVKEVIKRFDVKFMRDPTRGGIGGVLNEIVKGMDFGIVLNEKDIPIKDGVRGISELLGIDPLEVANEGKMIFVVEEKIAQDVLEVIKAHPDGKDGKIIGYITDEYKEKVIVISPYGSKRILHMPEAQGLPRIC